MEEQKALVAIIMGSDSDLGIMKKAVNVLEDFEVPYKIDIISAHRTPEMAKDFSVNAHKEGIKVIICGAGLAAHLAGSVSAHTPLPVIGVPIGGGKHQGVDSLYSTVQMPPGVPVATVGIDGAKNAALLAIQILGVSDKKYMDAILDFKKAQAKNIVEKSEKLKRIGYKKYLEG